MNKEYFLEKLKQPEYDFLNTHKDLGGNIILLTLGGSHAYGTNTETSDVDIRGICLNSKEEILTMNCKDKPVVNTATDTTVYYLKQIIQLLSNCNPNCIETLGTKEEHLLVLSPEGKMLRDNAKIFLSQRAINSFGGYATAQLRRLQNALARDSYPQKEKEKHILGSITGQMNHIQTNYTSFDENGIKLFINKSEKLDFDEEIFMDINLKNYPLRDFKAIYSDMSNVVKEYDSLNHRNSKKDDLHISKHILHLFRLLIMGTEILEGKGVHTYRQNDISFLMDLRNSKYVITRDNDEKDYSYIFELLDVYQKRFDYAKNNSPLPEIPNHNNIKELVMEINGGVINGR